MELVFKTEVLMPTMWEERAPLWDREKLFFYFHFLKTIYVIDNFYYFCYSNCR